MCKQMGESNEFTQKQQSHVCKKKWDRGMELFKGKRVMFVSECDSHGFKQSRQRHEYKKRWQRHEFEHKWQSHEFKEMWKIMGLGKGGRFTCLNKSDRGVNKTRVTESLI